MLYRESIRPRFDEIIADVRIHCLAEHLGAKVINDVIVMPEINLRVMFRDLECHAEFMPEEWDALEHPFDVQVGDNGDNDDFHIMSGPEIVEFVAAAKGIDKWRKRNFVDRNASKGSKDE